eukprot:7888359-Lingulodinium_polyedra.AAC.1
MAMKMNKYNANSDVAMKQDMGMQGTSNKQACHEQEAVDRANGNICNVRTARKPCTNDENNQ